MNNPEKELKDYLKRLVHNFIYLKSLLHQINLFIEWRKNNEEEEVKAGAHFYSLVLYSFKRVIVLETYKLLSEREIEDRTLIDWLNKAKIHFSSLKPSRFGRPSPGEPLQYIPLKKREYVELVDIHLNNVNEFKDLICNLHNLRDKNFAHSDKQYFDNPDKIDLDFPVSWDELNELFDCVTNILREHYSLIFNSDMDMHLHSAYDISTVLRSSRAFERFWKNKKLNELRIKKYVFKREDYNPDDIFLPELKE
jgi:hypothetical protein